MPRLAIDPSEIRLPDYGARRRIEVATAPQREALQRIQNLVEENKHLKTMNTGYVEEIGVILEENRALQQQVKATLKAYRLMLSHINAENKALRLKTRHEREMLPRMLQVFKEICLRHGVHPNTVTDNHVRTTAARRPRAAVAYDLCMAFPTIPLIAISNAVLGNNRKTLSNLLKYHMSENPTLAPYPQMSTK